MKPAARPTTLPACWAWLPLPQEGLEDYTAALLPAVLPRLLRFEDKSISGIFPDEMAAITKAFF